MRKITTKLFIAIGTATILLSVSLLYQSYKFTKRQVLEDAERNASMALNFDVAIRDYIAQHVRPVMYEFLGKEDFMPETMSTSFVARTIFEKVQKEFPNYIIKFSSDNPRNPLNQAGAEELKIIDYFNHNPQMRKWEGEISIHGKPYFAKFSAMRVEEACLRCHGDPENAPASLIRRYGSTAGFHRPLGKVIGMDTIAVPMVNLTEQLWPELRQAWLPIALALMLFFLSIICMTRFIVTKRLSSITKHFLSAAQQPNYQQLTLIEIEGNDEIRDLAFSYNTLCDRLKKFYFTLETQVKNRTRKLADKNEQMKLEIKQRKRMEEELQASEQFLKTLINAIPIPVFYKDTNGRYLGFNRAFEIFFGETREELIDKTVFDINPPELAEFYHVKDNELFESGGVQKYESQIKSGKGDMRHVIFNKAVFFDSQESVSGLIGTILDITERKQAETDLRKSELKYKTLIDNINSGVAVYEANNNGEDFIFLGLNKAGERIDNVRKEDLIGKSVLDVFPGIKDFGLFDVFKKVWETGKPEYFPITFYEDQRISGWREIYIYKLPSGEIIAVYNDKTEQKKSEEALRCSEGKYRKLVENLNDVIYLVDSNGTITYVSPPIESVLGYTYSDLVGKNYEDFAYPDDLDVIRQAFQDALHNRIYPTEFRIRTKNGDSRWVRTSGHPIYEGDQAIGLQGVLTDIDEHKQAERNLLTLTKRLESLWDITKIADADIKTISDHVLEALQKMTSSEYAFFEFLTEDEKTMVLHAWSKETMSDCRVTDKPLHFPIDKGGIWADAVREKHIITLNDFASYQPGKKGVPDGHVPLIRLMVVPVLSNGKVVSIAAVANKLEEYTKEDEKQVQVFLENVHILVERKQVEKALLESEKRFSTIFHTNPAAIALSRLDNNQLVNVNQAWQKTTGYTQSEALGHTPLELNLWVVPAQRERLTNMVRERGVARDEVQIRRKSGEIRDMLFSALLIELTGISYLLTMAQDITDRKKAEVALRESEKKYRSMMESFADPLYICSPDYKIEYMNPKMIKIIGRNAIGEPCYSVLHSNSNKCEWCDFDKVIEGEIVETNIKSPLDGRDYRTTSMPIHNQDGTIFKMATYKDITDYLKAISEREETQMQFIQSQKMESIGSLAGGIAHDFNNLLTTIIGNADFALDQAGENRSLYNDIEEIRKAGRQAAALTRQLLAFSRKQIIQPQTLNLNDILKNTEKMLRRITGEDIEFKTMFEPNLWDIKLDPGQIEQILMNLVVNAKDAMPTGGKLTIETTNAELDDVYFQNHGVKSMSGSYVMIAITDTGIGMDEKTRSSIFEPFFTTKERGQGTGLGLSTVYGIVKQNNGHIWADSELGKGTTFKIYFPRIKADEVSEIEEQVDENRLKGSETILVVEDSKTLLKLTQKMLESYGYKVLAAQSGNEAVEIFNRHDGLIHLLLTDVVMPGMSGRKLAEKIISEHPKVKVLYMSGYTDDTISKHGVLHDDVELIEKPFSQKNMGLKVREVLDQGIYD